MLRNVTSCLVLLASACAVPGQVFADQAKKIDVPAGELIIALSELAKQAACEFIYSADQLKGVRTSGAHGEYTAEQAVTKLLEGTNLKLTVHPTGALLISEVPAGSPGAAIGTEPASRDNRLRLAETTAVPAPAQDDGLPSGTLQEIVVTARKRDENLQRVPIAVEVMNAEQIQQKNITSLQSLSEHEPSIRISNAGRSSDMFIRGIGSGNNQGFEQKVGTFVDDIYHGRSRTTASSLLDLDHVEILKGPQTTFFGNNAIAGALNIVTKKPEDTFGGYVRALYGSWNTYAAESAVNMPVTDTLAARVAAVVDASDGWVTNVNTGERQPNTENRAGRLSLRYAPNEDFDATLKVEVSRNHNDSGLYLHLNGCPPSAPFTANGFCPASLAAGTPVGDERRNSQDPGQRIWLSKQDYTLTANYQLGGHTLTSVTGYYEYDYDLRSDTDATPLFLINVAAPEQYHQISQELRFTSPNDGVIDYMAGGYFHSGSLDMVQDAVFGFLSPVIQSLIPPLAGYTPLAQHLSYSQREKSYSVFGTLGWNATDQLKLSAGLRGTWVDKEYDQQIFYGLATQPYGGVVAMPAALQPVAGSLGLGIPGSLAGSRSDHAWMPSAQVQYRWTSNAQLYGSYTRGFLAGGFNPGDTSGNAASLPFKPEHVDAYEIGLKSEWFARSLLVNLSVFRSDYSDLQVDINSISPNGAIIGMVRNAATSRTQGVELQMQWAATRALRVSSNVSYLHSRYLSYQNAGPTAAQGYVGLAAQDLTDKPTQYAPTWSGNLFVAYTHELPAGFTLTGEVGALFSSEYFYSPLVDPTLEQDSYTRVDARLSLLSPDEKWTVELIGRNLNDEKITVFGIAQPTSYGSTVEQYQQPASVFLQALYRW